jgi:hypothetical protein
MSDPKPFNTSSLPSRSQSPMPSDPPAPRPTTLQRTDRILSRLTLLLSTPAGTDATLRTLGFTLQFLAAASSSLATRRLVSLARSLAASLAAVPLVGGPPGTALVVALEYPAPLAARLAPRAKVLSGLMSDFRTFSRLWGLLGMYAWAKSLAASPPKDKVLRVCAWGQCLAYTAYQALENRAYLAGKGVAPRDGQLILRDWLWSSRCWMVGVAFEFGRLARLWQLWSPKDKTDRERWEWWRDAIVNVANAPLTLHYSVAGGKLDEMTVGFLGTVAGIFSFWERWDKTALDVARK